MGIFKKLFNVFRPAKAPTPPESCTAPTVDEIELAKEAYDNYMKAKEEQPSEEPKAKPNKDPKARVVPCIDMVESDSTRHGREGKYTSPAKKKQNPFRYLDK